MTKTLNQCALAKRRGHESNCSGPGENRIIDRGIVAGSLV